MIKTSTNGKLPTFLKDEGGSTMILFGLTLLPAVMLVGGAVDFGSAYKSKQKIQAAADSAVLAAVAMPYGTQPAARETMAINVFNANAGGIAGVTPQASFANNTMTLTATGSVPTAFLKVAHIETISITGSSSGSVSYASTTTTNTSTTTTNTGKVCLLALDPSATNGFISQGTPNVNYENCWAHTNSTSATALAGGGSAVVVGAGHSAVGGVSSNAAGVYSPTPVSGAAVIADPFATVSAYTLPYTSYASTFTPPSIPETCKASGLSLKKGTFVLEPGRYCGGINIQAGATVTFQAGEYIIDNGLFNVQSGSSITGSNVLFYFSGANARFTIIGGGTVNLVGRSSGPDNLKGFVFVAHPNAWRGLTSNIQGGGTFNIEGMIYAPTQNILITGNGDSNANSNMFAIVAKSFEFRGNGIFRYKPRGSSSALPDILPNKTTTTTTTTSTSSQVVDKVKLN